MVNYSFFCWKHLRLKEFGTFKNPICGSCMVDKYYINLINK